jgi:hypothetical protein
MSDAFLFPRPDLARAYADALLGRTPFGHRGGLFLAAPRRTGKSTFLRRDLIPALEAEGVLTVYVDLWANRGADPGRLIAEAIRAALREESGLISKAARKAGLARVSVAGVVIDLDRIGAEDGATLTDALRTLAAAADRPVALVIDEAQHALSTEAGVAAMFALKAARDAMMQDAETETGGRPLALVFTGSHRDKLSALVLRRDQPFYGASVVDFPLLGRDYVDAYVAWLNARLASDNRFDPAEAFAAFDILGRRPELLEDALRDYALGPERAAGLGRTLADSAGALRERLWAQFDSDYGALTDLQRAVLARVIRDGEKLAPFSVPVLADFAAALGGPVAASDVQAALEALRQKGLIWKSGRGAYAVEDQGMGDWLAARMTAATSESET